MSLYCLVLRAKMEGVAKVRTASFRLTADLSSHSNWTVWMFPLAAEGQNKTSQTVKICTTFQGSQWWESNVSSLWSRLVKHNCTVSFRPETWKKTKSRIMVSYCRMVLLSRGTKNPLITCAVLRFNWKHAWDLRAPISETNWSHVEPSKYDFIQIKFKLTLNFLKEFCIPVTNILMNPLAHEDSYQHDAEQSFLSCRQRQGDIYSRGETDCVWIMKMKILLFYSTGRKTRHLKKILKYWFKYCSQNIRGVSKYWPVIDSIS